MQEEKYRFFQHRDCEYFPCHTGVAEQDFNCLFCYCPLYTLGEKCGGNFTYTESGIKNCTDCMVPHGRNAVQYVISRWPEICEIAKRRDPVEK